MKHFSVILQCQRALEVLVADVTVEPVLVLVALEVLVEQVLTHERPLAIVAWEFVRICVEGVVPGEVVLPRVLLGANLAAELAAVRVATLMIAQVALLGKRLRAGTANCTFVRVELKNK